MNCRQADSIMVKYLYGALSETAGLAVQQHLAGCERCHRQFDGYRRNQAELIELPHGLPTTSLARAAVDRWMQESGGQTSAQRYSWKRPFAWSAGLATCAVITFLLVTARHSSNQATGRSDGRDAPSIAGKTRFDRPAPDANVIHLEPRNSNPSRDPRTPTLRKFGPMVVKRAPARMLDDLDFLNTDSVRALRTWYPGSPAGTQNTASTGTTKHDADDFIRIEHPAIAGSDPKAISASEARYQQEKAVVDARLERKVNLAVKGISFSDLCKQLETETGIEFRAGRSVTDEKVTIFCEKQPLRDIMRQVTHLFGFVWGRSGEEKAYRYELSQDLRSQLEEERLRNQDYDAALIALDEAMDRYKPYMEMAKADLQKQFHDLLNSDKNKQLLQNASGGAFSAVQAYMRLTPAEIQALRAGNEVKFSTNAELPPGFPNDWSQRLLDSFKGISGPDGEIKVPSAYVTLSLDHTELGDVALSAMMGGGGIGMGATLATGKSPSAAHLNNRAENKLLQDDPALNRRVSLNPNVCKRPEFKAEFGIDFSKGRYIEDDIQDGVQPPDPHLNSADVWEELHVKSGIPIVADYYTHLFPSGGFAFDKRLLFDALCQSADALGAHWKKDGDFLQCRSATFFWDKLKEAPNRLLDKWHKDREASGGLPFDDLLEMSGLSDQQLNSLLVGQGVKHCRNIKEWNILADPQYAGTRRKFDQVRPFARFLAGVSPNLRHQALAPDGIAVTAFTDSQRDALDKLFSLRYFQGQIGAAPENLRLKVNYVPSGVYTWRVTYDSREDGQAHKMRVPVFTGKTPEEALAIAQKFYDKARLEDIHRCGFGKLTGTFIAPSGKEIAFGQYQASTRINQ